MYSRTIRFRSPIAAFHVGKSCSVIILIRASAANASYQDTGTGSPLALCTCLALPTAFSIST